MRGLQRCGDGAALARGDRSRSRRRPRRDRSRSSRDEWRLYQSRFITPEGRVVDTGNGGISHSEGQGYGMLLAVAYDDAAQFERLWRWTESHLQVRDDRSVRLALAARCADRRGGRRPQQRGRRRPADRLGAGARRARAGRSRATAPRRARSRATSWTSSAVEAGGRRLLLPGPAGLRPRRRRDGQPVLLDLPGLRASSRRSRPRRPGRSSTPRGVALLRAARFGRLAAAARLADARPSRRARRRRFPPIFGYNAIRIPLHLVWGGIDDVDLLRAVPRLCRGARRPRRRRPSI